MQHQPLTVLRKFRERNGMNLADFARFLEESSSTVLRWETGARKIGPERLHKVAQKTNISPNELRPDLAKHFEGAQ
jgi:transcriptional regulator with XRE-family HTH domain